jgi:very-short-patch-repair endonuclease
VECRSHALAVHPGALAVLEQAGGFATTAQLMTVMTRQQLDVQVKNGGLVRVWYGVYAAQHPNLLGRLAALDVFMGRHAVACMGTAAALYGFDTENTTSVHVLDPGVRTRPAVGLMVHQRTGAPLQRVAGRLATAPDWTAVEVARQLGRPRALATLDAALHTTQCSIPKLQSAIAEQRGRRGIVAVRELLRLADGRAESAMESEARLVMIDRGVPLPQLQYPIYGRDGELWRVDFAWPDAHVAAEYESIDWHAGRTEMLRDKARWARIQEVGWSIIPIVVHDVRREPDRLAERIITQLERVRMAG